MKKKRQSVIKGKRLNYNVGVQQNYINRLVDLVRRMRKEVTQKVLSLFRSSTAKEFKELTKDESISSQARILMSKLAAKFNQLFSKRSKPYAEKMVNEELTASKVSLKSSLKEMSGGVTINTGLIPKSLEEVGKAAIAQNIGLIKSISQEYMQTINGTVMRAISAGGNLGEITDALMKSGQVTERRAREIARDQTRKAFNHISKEKMLAMGLKKFMWRHSGGGQTPRKLHQEYDGQIFSFDDLPIIEEGTTIRGIPGDAINCGCTMEPVFEFEDDE
jgi:SPP1 gp7 family putative phage head morphogenesis protein